MYKKACSGCGKVSYSLSNRGRWICPHCGDDISNEPVKHPPAGLDWVIPLAAPAQDSLCRN